MSTIERIQAIRKEKGIKISVLCAKLKLNPNYLNDVAKGKTMLTDDRLAQIAEILDTTPEYLRGETDIKEKPAENGELTELEQKLLDTFRSLSETQQKALLYDLLNSDKK